MSFIEMNKSSPIVEYEWLDPFINQFNRAYTIELRSNHTPIPDNFMGITSKLRNVPPEKRHLTEVLTMPQNMADSLWNQIVDGTHRSFGPRVVISMEEINGRGNYIVLGDEDNWVFVWAPVFESTEFFARHWAILRYCFETNLVSSRTRLWGVGETLRENDLIKINHYSGSFEPYIGSSIAKAEISVLNHYNLMLDMISERFSVNLEFVEHDFPIKDDRMFDDLKVRCDRVPDNIQEFDKDKCYRYNVLPGVLKHFSLYDILFEKNTYNDVFPENSIFAVKGYLEEFKSELTRMTRMV